VSFLSIVQRAAGVAVGAANTLRALLIPEVQLYNQFSRIGGGLMPNQIANIIREADVGRPARLVDLVHEGRQKDGHTQAVLGVRELSLASLKWSIDPPEDADENEKAEALLCEKALRACGGWHVLLAHLAGEGNLFPTGAWAEIAWEYKLTGELAGREVPILAKPISCRRFGFKRTDGSIVFVEAGQDPESKGIDLFEEYGPGNFICFRPRVNGDVAVREGLARTIVWNLVYRNWGVRDWALAGEMGWKPWMLAQYKKGSDGKDRAFAEEAIEALTASGGAAYPETVDLKVSWPKSTGSNLQSVHRELCEFFGQEISKAVLGQTLTTEAGSRGARSLGDIHENILHMINEGDARGIAESLNLCLVEPYYAFNHGDSMRRGTLRFHTEDGVDLEIMAKVVSLLVAAGVKIPQGWVRDQIGCPDPTDEDELCEPRDSSPEGGGDGSGEDVKEAA
jgi:phage gp29-like protein